MAILRRVPFPPQIPTLPPKEGEPFGRENYEATREGVIMGAEGPPVEKPGWKLTFQDEFDRPQLNDMYWFPAYR